MADAAQLSPLLLALAVVGVMEPDLTSAMLAVGIVFCVPVLPGAHPTLAVREETFIEASSSIGTLTSWVLRRHLLPNVLSPLAVQISLALGFAILAESSLSILGLEVQPPEENRRTARASSTRRGPSFVPASPWSPRAACSVLGDGLSDLAGRERARARHE